MGGAQEGGVRCCHRWEVEIWGRRGPVGCEVVVAGGITAAFFSIGVFSFSFFLPFNPSKLNGVTE